MNFNKISRFEKPEESIGFLIWRISTAWRTSLELVLKPLSLTHPQFVMLAVLGWMTRKGDLVSQAAVAQMAGLDPNTASQIMRGLELKKFIKRVPSADLRVKNPLLTQTGKQALSQAMPAIENADEAFFKVLTKDEHKVLLHIFQKLSKDVP